MRILNKKKVIISSALLIASIGAIGVSAQEGIDNLNQTSGHAIIQDSGVQPKATVSVGGGTWNYGTECKTLTTKKAWSKYQHHSKKHSSSVSIGSNSASSGWKNPGVQANSEVTGTKCVTAEAFWNVQ